MDLIKKRKMDENGLALPAADTSLLDSTITKLSPEDVRKLLDPFTRDQFLEILHPSVTRHMDILAAVRAIADRDPAQRKLFIRGLGWETTNEGLRNLFSGYGELEEAVVILDKTTGKSKGYGFVTFKHVDGALLALKEPSKKIDGRMTVTQLAAAGASGNNSSVGSAAADVSNRKIYVANVPFDMPADRLLAHFSSYGEIEEGPLGFDKLTGKSRGFALFVYKTPEAAQAALVDPTKMIDGRQLVCKLAIEGKKNKPGMVGGPGNQTGVGVPGDVGDGHGLQHGNSMPGSIGGQYVGPGGPGGYGWFSGGLQGSAPQLGHHHAMNSTLPPSLGGGGGGPGLSSAGGQPPSALGGSGGGYGVGMGGSFGGSHYGGPGSAGYGGLGGAGGGSSLYGRLPPTSAGIPSGGYPDGGHYGLSSSSAFPTQTHQPTGTSPAPRVPPGGMYSSMPPYF